MIQNMMLQVIMMGSYLSFLLQKVHIYYVDHAINIRWQDRRGLKFRFDAIFVILRKNTGLIGKFVSLWDKISRIFLCLCKSSRAYIFLIMIGDNKLSLVQVIESTFITFLMKYARWSERTFFGILWVYEHSWSSNAAYKTG